MQVARSKGFHEPKIIDNNFSERQPKRTLIRCAAFVGMGSLPPLDRSQDALSVDRATPAWTAQSCNWPNPMDAALQLPKGDIRGERPMMTNCNGGGASATISGCMTDEGMFP